MALSEGIDASGMPDGQFICQLVGRFSEMLGSLIDRCVEASMEKMQLQEKVAEELLESVQELRKENMSMEATIARLKDQNECYRIEINRYSRLA